MQDRRKRTAIVAKVRAVRRTLNSLDDALARIERDLLEAKITRGTEEGEDGETVGQRIANTRKAKGLTQADVARRAGMASSQLCKIEKDVNGISARTSRRVASALGVSVAWLLEGRQ